MTADQLLHLGVQQVVYVRSVNRAGTQVFVIHGADGTALATMESAEEAIEAATDNGLGFVTVH